MENLLRELSELRTPLDLAALTRRPELVPAGIRPVEVRATSQVFRMAVSVPRVLRDMTPSLVHFQYALPRGCPCPSVVTVHDVSFELSPELMPRRDRAVFRTVVPRSVRHAAAVITVSARTKRDLLELYGLPESKVIVIPNGVDPVFTPGENGARDYALVVGAVQRRKDPLAALRAAEAVGLRLVVVGPEKDSELTRELARLGAEVKGYVTKRELAELYRGAACLLFPSRFEGFGLPVLEAMASGTPVVATDEPALREVAGSAAVLVPASDLAAGVENALASREKLVAAGLERAAEFSWARAARQTIQVYREVLRL